MLGLAGRIGWTDQHLMFAFVRRPGYGPTHEYVLRSSSQSCSRRGGLSGSPDPRHPLMRLSSVTRMLRAAALTRRGSRPHRRAEQATWAEGLTSTGSSVRFAIGALRPDLEGS